MEDGSLPVRVLVPNNGKNFLLMVVEDVPDEGPEDPVSVLGLEPVSTLGVIKLVNPLTRREDEEELGLFELLVAAELGALH
jgi:hypothetical protein